MTVDTVSVVIPVYNSAPFLPSCLDSMLSQTYPDIEILLIENGSTDDSPRICERYARQDARIRLLQGPHTGPGAARNCGIDAAAGRYVVFVDSDDLCEPELVERLASAGAGKDATLALCGIQVMDEDGLFTETFAEAPASCTIREYVAGPLAKWGSNPLCGAVYCKLFDIRILRDHHIFFEEDTSYAEDFCFNMAYLRHMENVIILPDLLYRYRCGRKGSVTEKNLRDSEFSPMWQRRLEVIRMYEDVYAFFGMSERCAPTVAAFRWLQMADMITLAVRRTPDYPSFHADMEILRNDRKGHEVPAGIPARARLSLRLLLSRHDRILWQYEYIRKKIRTMRGRERWGT